MIGWFRDHLYYFRCSHCEAHPVRVGSDYDYSLKLPNVLAVFLPAGLEQNVWIEGSLDFTSDVMTAASVTPATDFAHTNQCVNTAHQHARMLLYSTFKG